MTDQWSDEQLLQRHITIVKDLFRNTTTQLQLLFNVNRQLGSTLNELGPHPTDKALADIAPIFVIYSHQKVAHLNSFNEADAGITNYLTRVPHLDQAPHQEHNEKHPFYWLNHSTEPLSTKPTVIPQSSLLASQDWLDLDLNLELPNFTDPPEPSPEQPEYPNEGGPNNPIIIQSSDSEQASETNSITNFLNDPELPPLDELLDPKTTEPQSLEQILEATPKVDKERLALKLQKLRATPVPAPPTTSTTKPAVLSTERQKKTVKDINKPKPVVTIQSKPKTPGKAIPVQQATPPRSSDKSTIRESSPIKNSPPEKRKFRRDCPQSYNGTAPKQPRYGHSQTAPRSSRMGQSTRYSQHQRPTLNERMSRAPSEAKNR